ncbi:MAG: sulfatase [Opitutus sp.]|nr:sulfatase [Opitutus sp.]
MKTPFPFVASILPGVLLALGLALTSSAARAAAVERPNILWLVSEDNIPILGCYGEPLARTPNLDRLAKEGICYEKNYSPAPVCAPTRSSLITGCYATSLGTQHMRSQRALPEGFKFFPEYLRAAGYYCTNNAKTDYNTSTDFSHVWNASSRQAHYKNRAPGQPFFAVFNHESSHESVMHQRKPLITDPAKVVVPAYLPDNAETRADLAQYHDQIAIMDGQIGAKLRELEEAGLAEDTIVFYYGDNGGVLPRSKRFMYENGLHVPLIIRFPKKFQHLAPAAPGSRSTELVNFVDYAPTVLSLVGLPLPAHLQGRAIAGPARGPAREYDYQFRGRMDERYDLSYAVTDGRHRYIRNYLPHVPAGQHVDFLWRQASMREWAKLYSAGKLNAVQSAFFRERAPEELFDLAADPDNVRNLAADPARRAVLERLRAAHHAHLLRIRDAGFMPEPMMVPLAGARSPRTITQNEAIYPLARLVDLIDRLQLPPAPAPKDLAAALADPLPIVRYWGTMAALRAPAVAAPTLERLLADPEPLVRLGAAQALLRGGESATAWKAIADCVAPDQRAELRLAAMNVITLQGKWPESLRPLLTASGATKTASGENYVARAAEFLLAPDAPAAIRENPGGE